MKSILIVYYTQTGQLRRIIDSLVRPLSGNPQFSIDYLELSPETAFPFPWTRMEFLNVFPETVMEVPVRLKPCAEPGNPARYDLVILAFQPWYLSPSLPVSTFLNSPAAEKVLKGADVLTVIGSRNMWIGAFNQVKQKIEGLGGRLCGNIALIDRAPNLVSVVTIVYWMFTGRKDNYLGIFPKPGVSEEDIAAAGRFGAAIGPALLENRLDRLEDELKKLGAYEINSSLARLETRARKVFTLWAKLIIKSPKRRTLLLNLFFTELIFALAVISPINSLIGFIAKSLKGNSRK
ncbi:MAG: dialkylresorcinol condensing enzyme DarA [Syntrophaceae bacterium]